MCGIAGIFNLNREPVDSASIQKMTAMLSHRGPDGQGLYIDDFIALGHRRLAILDLSPLGSQPMVSDDKNYAITYNGEIYNYLEIKADLESLGHQFRSHSDAEAVLHAYIEWGDKCVHRFNGMFAFAIWDRPRQELFLARDRYGIKPLYYCFRGKNFLFASEQKAILTQDINREVDLEALFEYFTFQNIFTDKTLLKGIRIFPAGSWARVCLEQSESEIHAVQYWDYDFKEPEQPADEREYLEELDRLFNQAVKRQLLSDVEVGSYLSGGMDSGSITAIAAQELPYIKTFTCGFDLHSASGLELAFDERDKAEFMSYLFKTEHYEIVLKAGDMERVMPSLAWHLEEPRVGQSYPNYYIAQLASKFVKVVLAGTGGDELFGGYPWRYYRALVNENFNNYINKYYEFWQRLVPGQMMPQLFKPVWRSVKDVNTRDIFKNVFKNREENLQKPNDYVNHSLYFEARTFLHGLLVIEDKLSMAHGLETRVPFLDNDLVDFAMKMPVNLKLRNLKEIILQNENEPGPKSAIYYQKTNEIGRAHV